MNKIIKTYASGIIEHLKKSSLYSFYSLFTENQIPSKAFMNTKAIQSFRMKKASALINKRRQKKKKENLKDYKLIQSELDVLEDDGILVVNDFLPEYCLNEINQYRKSVINDNKKGLKHFELRGAEYLDGMIEELLPDTFKYLQQNTLMNVLPKIYLGRSSTPKTWRLKYIRDLSNQMDQNCINHSDTFHNTLKIWIYLDDVSANQDSLKFWKKSHLPDKDIDELRLRAMLKGHGSPRVDEDILEKFGYVRFNESIKSNTLIVADTYGFHYRNYAPSKINWRPTIFCSLRYSPFN
jgi:hypothetical protein